MKTFWDFTKTQPGERWRIFDANGIEWRYVRTLDCITGLIEQIVFDSEGYILVERGEVVTHSFCVATPVTVMLVDGAKIVEERDAVKR